MINVLYIHGYGSSVTRPGGQKIDQLGCEFSQVHRIAPNYDLGFESVVGEIASFIVNAKSEYGVTFGAVIGTSMGGLMAQYIADEISVPYVSINPVMSPRESLAKYGVEPFALVTYPDYSGSSRGMMIVGMQDEVINPYASVKHARNVYMPLVMDNTGDHRFEDISGHIDQIAEFLYSASAHGSYGLVEDY